MQVHQPAMHDTVLLYTKTRHHAHHSFYVAKATTTSMPLFQAQAAPLDTLVLLIKSASSQHVEMKLYSLPQMEAGKHYTQKGSS